MENWEDGVHYLRLAGCASPSQQKIIDLIENKLASVNNPNSPFWTNEHLRTNPDWDVIRKLAKDLLCAFGWDEGVPDRTMLTETIIVVPSGTAAIKL